MDEIKQFTASAVKKRSSSIVRSRNGNADAKAQHRPATPAMPPLPVRTNDTILRNRRFYRQVNSAASKAEKR
jgi:hypothetical protein